MTAHLPFQVAEYAERVAKTKERMAASDLDVLLAADPANMNYLTGFDAWSFYVPQLVFVALDRQRPIWVGRAMDASTAEMTTFLEGEDVLSYAEEFIDSPDRHPMEYAAYILRECGWDSARIGVEMDAYYFSAKCLEVLRTSLPGARFEDAYLLVNWIRCVKSDSEIAFMRQAARIAEKAMRRGIETIEPGVRECDAVAEIVRAQIGGDDTYGGVFPSTCALLLPGERMGAPHATWTDAPLERDQGMCLELAGCRHRYHAALARTVHLGPPPARLVELAKAAGEGMEAALAAVRPGAVARDVEAAWRATIARAGYQKPSRIGHSIGIGYPPDWGEHTVSLRAEDETVLEPNMTFHMIVGMWMDGWGYELSETIRVTEAGVEALTDFPRQLFVKT